MKHSKMFFVAIFIVASATAHSVQAATKSKSTTMACGGGVTITDSLAKLAPGDTLTVSGTCLENVYVAPEVSNITIDGQGTATIQAADASLPAIRVRGRAITIRGFVITGGNGGIELIDGAFAWIHGNVVTGNANWGIQVASGSTARIWNNTVSGNTAGGILVNRNSYAYIGVVSAGDATASPNTITGNTGDAGIAVSRSSAALIVGNTITSNFSDGVIVLRGSQADIASNTISSNGNDGIEIVHNSTVHLGNTGTGTSIYDLPNAGSNNRYGVSCSGGGYVRGRLGALAGSTSATNVTGCSGLVDP
jgi:parallel beta-helix repeat protein